MNINETELTPELVIAEGLARAVVYYIQDCRKLKRCDFTDRILVGIVTKDENIKSAMQQFRQYIQTETLTDSLWFRSIPGIIPIEIQIGNQLVDIYLKNLSKSQLAE